MTIGITHIKGSTRRLVADKRKDLTIPQPTVSLGFGGLRIGKTDVIIRVWNNPGPGSQREGYEVYIPEEKMEEIYAAYQKHKEDHPALTRGSRPPNPENYED